jgi:hypothetical protein
VSVMCLGEAGLEVVLGESLYGQVLAERTQPRLIQGFLPQGSRASRELCPRGGTRSLALASASSWEREWVW